MNPAFDQTTSSPGITPGSEPVQGLWLEDLRRITEARISWLWHGILPPGSVTLLTSQWKSGKTTLLGILLAKLGTGGDLAGLPLAAGKAAVISEEGRAAWLSRAD